MDSISIIAFLLLVGVMVKEISYFTPNMIFTYKSVVDRVIFGFGILVLLWLTIKFASTIFQIAFGVIGIVAFGAMWIKQGISEKGVLTIAHYGQEFFSWDSISCVKLEEGKVLQVEWIKEDGSLILKQKYRGQMRSALCKQISNHGIQIII